jgi:hypothetical protein
MTQNSQVEVTQTTDALVWAKEFMRLFEDRREDIDADLMLTWFANAIETGRTAGDEAVIAARGMFRSMLEELRDNIQKAAEEL